MAEFKDIKKILIIKLRHIGDCLLTIPAIRAVRETFPSAYIAALVNRGTEDVVTGNLLLNDVVVFDRNILKLPVQKRLINELAFVRKIRNISFDMTIDFTSGDRPAIYSYLSGARYRLAYNPVRKGFLGKALLYTHCGKTADGIKHTVLKNLHLVRQFGMNTDDLSVDISFSEEDHRYVEKLLTENGLKPHAPFVHIHPTSRWLFKCWKDEYMAEVIRWLIENGNTVVITSSPDRREMEKAKKILSLYSSLVTRHSSLVIDLCGKTTIKQLAALSQKACLFFGVDSAPMHIAAAVDTPVVALFGPSGAFHWGPWDNNYRGQGAGGRGQEKPYSKRNGVQRFGKHTVIQKDWECIPCGKDGCDGSKISNCLEDITVDEVMREIEAHLTGK